MKYEPHSYQKYAIEYLKSHPVSTWFLDCGLGKTSITLTAINELLFDSFFRNTIKRGKDFLWHL